MSLNRGTSDNKWNNFLTDSTYVGLTPTASASSATSIDINFFYDPTVIDSVDVWLLDATTYSLVSSLGSILISPAVFSGLVPGSYVGIVRQNPKSTSGYIGTSGPTQPSNVVTLSPPPPIESFITDLVPTGTGLSLTIYNSQMVWYWDSGYQNVFRIQVASDQSSSPSPYGIEIANLNNDGTVQNVVSYKWNTADITYMQTFPASILPDRKVVVPVSFQDTSYVNHLAFYVFDTQMNYTAQAIEFLPNNPNIGYGIQQSLSLPSGSTTCYFLTTYGGQGGSAYGNCLFKLNPLTGAIFYQNEIEWPTAAWNGGYGSAIGIDLTTENLALATVLYDLNYVYYMSTARWDATNTFNNVAFWRDYLGGSPSGYPNVSAITPDMYGHIYFLWNNNGVLKLNKIDSTNTVLWQTEFSYPGAYIYKGAVQPIYTAGVVTAIDVVLHYGFSGGPPTYNYNYYINITRLDNAGTPMWSRDFYPTDSTGVDNYQVDTGNYPGKFNFYNNEWIITGSLNILGSPRQFAMSIDTDTTPTIGVYTLSPSAGVIDEYWGITNTQLNITYGTTPTLTPEGGAINLTPPSGAFYISNAVYPSTSSIGAADYWRDEF